MGRTRVRCGSARPARCRLHRRRLRATGRPASGASQLLAEVGEQAPAAAGATGGRETPASAHPDRARALTGRSTAPLPSDHDPDRHDLRGYLDATRDERLESYKAFLRIPSISALPAHRDDCRATATWLAAALERAGAEHVALEETDRQPGRLRGLAPCRPRRADGPRSTATYDVQPVDPLDLWTSPPFEPVVVGDRMLARGSADDKGQIHPHVTAARRPPRHPRRLPVNVRYLFEGNEEDDARPSQPVADGKPRAADRRRGRHQRHGLLRGQHAGDHDRPARDDVRPDRRRGRRSTSIRGRTAARSRTRPTRSPRSSPRSRARRPDPHPGLLRRRRRPDRPGARGARGPAVRRGGLPRRDRRLGARRRGRAHRPSSASRAARPSTSTASGAASRAKGRRRSSRPKRTPRSAAGSSRTRTRTTSSRS